MPTPKRFGAKLVPQLDAMGVLTQIDCNALARYCRLWARWRRAEAFIEKHGEMYPLKDDRGKIRCFQQFPQVATANKLAQQLTRLEQEFGMTPLARADSGGSTRHHRQFEGAILPAAEWLNDCSLGRVTPGAVRMLRRFSCVRRHKEEGPAMFAPGYSVWVLPPR